MRTNRLLAPGSLLLAAAFCLGTLLPAPTFAQGDKMQGDKMKTDKMADSKMANGKMTDGKMADGKMSDSKMATGKMSSVKTARKTPKSKMTDHRMDKM